MATVAEVIAQQFAESWEPKCARTLRFSEAFPAMHCLSWPAGRFRAVRCALQSAFAGGRGVY